MSYLKRSLGVGALALFAVASVQADDTGQVQAASLEVKARIKSMERVNVTAEKTLDTSVPAASAKVEDLLTELEVLDTAAAAPEPDAAEDSRLAAGAVLNEE